VKYFRLTKDILILFRIEMIKQENLKELLSKTQKEKEHLTIFYRGAREILELHPFEVTAKKLFDFCKEITGATAGYVALLSGDGKKNKVLFLNSCHKVVKMDPYLSMPVHDLCKDAYKTKKTVYHNDFMNSPWRESLPVGHLHVRNILFAPLIIENKPVGVIGLANKPEDFNEYDASMTTAFGNLAASALHNSWLFEEIRKQNSGKEKLISIISHDVKNLLNNVHGFSHLLLSEVKNKNMEKVLRFAEIINFSSSDANRLLDDLLIWVKTNSGKMTFTPKKFDLNSVVNKAVKQYKHVARQRKICVSYYNSQPIMVFADKKMISTILRNLIGNAVKFTENGKITITARPLASDIEISVADTGIGMTDRQVESLFEPSNDLRLSEIRKERSSGLGLLLCKEFIDLHGKNIEVKSEPGKGSTFSFSLPIAE
jgi:signal transduction histidine kinase